jgi:uridine kinase
MKEKPIFIGIAGASGSGKTLLSSSIFESLDSSDVFIIKEDHYYKDLIALPPDVRSQKNFDHPDALDHELLAKHLFDIQNGKSVQMPQYDFKTHSRISKTITVKPHKVFILEGILVFADVQLRNLMNIKIFVDTALDICLTRRIKRDIAERGRTLDSVLKQYDETVRPMYLQFIEPSKRYADIIVPRGGRNAVAKDMIMAKINSLLEK